MPRQQEISFHIRGGKRRGAGRPPSGERSGVSHARRSAVTPRAPLLVTMKVKPHVWNLRTVRIARSLNRMMGRTGTVFADRYHDRVLATPRQVRAAIAYVLGNARKHAVKLPLGGLDPYSSAAAFTGWLGRVVAANELARVAAALVVPARSWLLAVGWQRGGALLDPDHRPGPLPT